MFVACMIIRHFSESYFRRSLQVWPPVKNLNNFRIYNIIHNNVFWLLPIQGRHTVSSTIQNLPISWRCSFRCAVIIWKIPYLISSKISLTALFKTLKFSWLYWCIQTQTHTQNNGKEKRLTTVSDSGLSTAFTWTSLSSSDSHSVLQSANIQWFKTYIYLN